MVGPLIREPPQTPFKRQKKKEKIKDRRNAYNEMTFQRGFDYWYMRACAHTHTHSHLHTHTSPWISNFFWFSPREWIRFKEISLKVQRIILPLINIYLNHHYHHKLISFCCVDREEIREALAGPESLRPGNYLRGNGHCIWAFALKDLINFRLVTETTAVPSRRGSNWDPTLKPLSLLHLLIFFLMFI